MRLSLSSYMLGCSFDGVCEMDPELHGEDGHVSNSYDSWLPGGLARRESSIGVDGTGRGGLWMEPGAQDNCREFGTKKQGIDSNDLVSVATTAGA